jgi:hypothetical protein
MALPPFMSISTPANVANGWLDATMPFLASTENFSAIVFLAIKDQAYFLPALKKKA